MEQKNAVLPLITNKYFLDLGVSPFANSFVAPESSYKMEPFIRCILLFVTLVYLYSWMNLNLHKLFFMTIYTSALTHPVGYYTLNYM